MNTSAQPSEMEIEEAVSWPVVSRVTARKTAQPGFHNLYIFIPASEEAAFPGNNEFLPRSGMPSLADGPQPARLSDPLTWLLSELVSSQLLPGHWGQ